MAARLDLTGQRFGRLTVITTRDSNNRGLIWECLCDCGETCTAPTEALRRTYGVQSCGCVGREKDAAARTELLGQKFSRWTVVKFSHMARGNTAYWICQCDCGNTRAVTRNSLAKGQSKSCGCLRDEVVSERRYIHGMSNGTSEYSVWNNMRRRCQNPDNVDYGGRGITVDPAFDDFPTFIAHIGLKPFPKAQLDRIDNEKGYAPGNVRWVTARENSLNRRNTQWVIPGRLLLSDALRETMVNTGTIEKRARREGLCCAEHIRDNLSLYGLEHHLGESRVDSGENISDRADSS